MPQFIFFTYTIALVLGFVSIGIVGIMALWIKKRNLFIIFLFYSAYTLDMFVEIVHRYILINIPELWENIFSFLNPVMIFSRFFHLFSILIFSHHFAFKGCKKRMALVYAFFSAACFFVSLIEYLSSTKSNTLGITIPDYFYFAIICLILLLGIRFIIISKQATSEFLSQHEYSFLKKIIVIFSISFLLIINDDFSFIVTPLRFAPLIYTLFSILICHYVYRIYRTIDYFSKENDPSNSSVFQRFSISGREKEIVLLVLKGYSNKRIGEELFISLSTVKAHIYKIYKKMNIKTRFELMQYFKSV